MKPSMVANLQSPTSVCLDAELMPMCRRISDPPLPPSPGSVFSLDIRLIIRGGSAGIQLQVMCLFAEMSGLWRLKCLRSLTFLVHAMSRCQAQWENLSSLCRFLSLLLRPHHLCLLWILTTLILMTLIRILLLNLMLMILLLFRLLICFRMMYLILALLPRLLLRLSRLLNRLLLPCLHLHLLLMPEILGRLLHPVSLIQLALDAPVV